MVPDATKTPREWRLRTAFQRGEIIALNVLLILHGPPFKKSTEEIPAIDSQLILQLLNVHYFGLSIALQLCFLSL